MHFSPHPLLTSSSFGFVNERNFDKILFMVDLRIDIRTKEMLKITPCTKCCFL